MTDSGGVLRAGGLVPASAKLGRDAAVDVVIARAYRHAALPGRTIVRLSAENVAEGDELEMATLGFAPGEPRGAVAQERKRPLGFPGWALVHDPKNARYALGVMREFKRFARMAKARPAQAREGFDTIGAVLGASVPHFLPAFYEEAGRAFLEHGAPGPAASMFGKAREAEAVHALPVDEQHRVDAFLEFALAGAVTTKALAHYAKDLVAHHEPAVAYAHFRQLCVQRTLGGLPPWSGMVKELRRLAKAARLDADAEDAAFVAEIIASPALGKAASEFWRAYQPALVRIGRESAAARGALLNLFPTGAAYSAELDALWLDLLDETGASEALVADGAPAAARPNGGRAAWFDKLLQHLSRAWRAAISPRALVLLRRMAPALIRDGAPIACAGRQRYVDLDVAELALELGVPIALPEQAAIDLEAWAKGAGDPERGRDPVLAAAHPRLGPVLEAAVGAHVGRPEFDAASRGKQGFLAAKRAWLERAIARAEGGGLPGVEEALALVNEKVAAATFAELPDLHARFAAIDLAPALARTLQIGLLDELGWPALEDAVDELGPDATLHGGPPAVIVATKARAIAVGPRGRLAEHDLAIPPRHELHSIRFIDGEFLVLLKGEIYRLRAYWSRAPRDVFETELSAYSVAPLVERAAVLESGAWIESLAPMRAGTRALSFGTELRASDGRTSWTSEWHDGVLRWREITASGEAGRFSWPAFIEAGLDGEWRVDDVSYVLPAPGGVGESPLGVAAGLVGARVRSRSEPDRPRAEWARELAMIDGARWSGTADVALGELATAARRAQPTCVVRLPCGGEPRLVLERREWKHAATFLLDPAGRVRGSRIDDRDRRYVRGQAGALAPAFWHARTPRDPAGSRRLRAITDADARALIGAVPVQTSAPAGVAHPPPDDVTAGVLALEHPRLRRGVTGVAVLAAQLRLERDRLARERAPAKAGVRGDGPRHGDAELLTALTSWAERSGWGRGGDAWRQIERTAEVWAGDRADRVVRELPFSMFDWLPLAAARWSLAFIASALGTPAEHRRAVVDLLALITAALPPPERLRVYTLRAPLPELGRHALELAWIGGNAYAILDKRVLEYAPAGAFAVPYGLAITGELRGAPGPTRDDIAALATAIAQGQTSWAPARVAALAEATGLVHSEASFLAAGCPSPSAAVNFLPKELREQLGLRSAQAAAARDSVLAVPLLARLAVVEEAARGGVAALFDGRAIDALAPAWNRTVGRRAAISEELATSAGRVLAARHKPSEALAMIAAPAAPQLAADGVWTLDAGGDVARAADAPPAFDAAALQTIANYVPYLYAELPVGDPLRARAADAYDRALERLANPGLWLDGGVRYVYEAADRAMAEQLVGSIGGEPIDGLHDGIRGTRIPGAALVLDHHRIKLRLHPASLDADAAPAVKQLVDVVAPDGEAWRMLGVVRGADLAAIAARIRATPVPAGGYEQNPLASAPELVARVAGARDLSHDAAALYLQFLALLWPTPRNLQLWNGWSPVQLDAATAELVARALVLEAKRERAQRTHFLPGAWEADKPPHPPRELWKRPLYAPSGAPPLGRYLALAPFHALFARAWERVESGDPPRYEEVLP